MISAREKFFFVNIDVTLVEVVFTIVFLCLHCLLKSLLKNQACAKMIQLPSPDARSPGKRSGSLFSYVSNRVKRIPGQAIRLRADPEAGDQRPDRLQSHLL